VGFDLRFDERGSTELKGISGSWRRYVSRPPTA
jgi:hypothetical protein